MPEQIASNIGPDGIELAYETLGDASNPPLLLIMGIASQMIHWPQGLLDELVQRELFVVRFDNRDSGNSTHLHEASAPNFQAILSGQSKMVPYTLSDMAADCIGLLDHLGIEQAHVVGASMGGFIAQTLAIEYPQRILSLTSIMSNTGNMAVGQPDPAVFVSLGGIQPSNRDEVIAQALLAFELVGSPGYPKDEAGVRERASLAYDRCYDPVGVVRQSVACIASGDRTAKLKLLNLPTLVIHGENDRMCDVSGGRATAEAIPGAKLLTYPGLGHDLPKALWPEFAELIKALVDSTQLN